MSVLGFELPDPFGPIEGIVDGLGVSIPHLPELGVVELAELGDELLAALGVHLLLKELLLELGNAFAKRRDIVAGVSRRRRGIGRRVV